MSYHIISYRDSTIYSAILFSAVYFLVQAGYWNLPKVVVVLIVGLLLIWQGLFDIRILSSRKN